MALVCRCLASCSEGALRTHQTWGSWRERCETGRVKLKRMAPTHLDVCVPKGAPLNFFIPVISPYPDLSIAKKTVAKVYGCTQSHSASFPPVSMTIGAGLVGRCAPIRRKWGKAVRMELGWVPGTKRLDPLICYSQTKKEVDAVLTSILGKVNGVKSSLSGFVGKMEGHEQLTWYALPEDLMWVVVIQAFSVQGSYRTHPFKFSCCFFLLPGTSNVFSYLLAPLS